MGARALIIGVQSPSYVALDNLLSVPNDCREMKKLLSGRGFESVDELRDRKASISNVLGAIKDASDWAGRGDLFVIYYSGHGGTSADTNGDEPDRQDETLCLDDGPLVDDRLWERWTEFSDGARVVALTDCCHSGSIVRALRPRGGEGKRSWRVKPRHVRRKRELPIPTLGLSSSTSRAAGNRDVDDLKCSLLHLAACRDKEDATEVGQHGIYTGALLRAAGTSATYNEMFDHIVSETDKWTQGHPNKPQHAEIGLYGRFPSAFRQQRAFDFTESWPPGG